MVTLEVAKAQLRIDSSWTGDDALVSSYIASATAEVLSLTGYRYPESMTAHHRTIAVQAVLLLVDYYYNQQPQTVEAAHRLTRQIRQYRI